MRRLYPRGLGARGVVVDAEGAMLGPDCVLVRGTPQGCRSLPAEQARAIQAALFDISVDPEWLFGQCRQIAAALDRGELALAQIYGLRIPITELDRATLRRLSTIASLAKANFDPDEPRIPKGEPGAGQWTYEDGYAKPRDSHTRPAAGAAGSDDSLAATQGASGSTEGDAPPEAGGDESPRIPAEPPDTAQERNSIVRRAAQWLASAAAAGASVVPDVRIRAFFYLLEATAWIVAYLPEIESYLDDPKTLEALQQAVADRQPGYQIHHIVETQYNSNREDNNARRFADRLEARENRVLIPTWKHVEISSWYSTHNDAYGGLTPRAYLRGRSWEQQYEVGLRTLRLYGVLK
jgi:hypothetical protein